MADRSQKGFLGPVRRSSFRGAPTDISQVPLHGVDTSGSKVMEALGRFTSRALGTVNAIADERAFRAAGEQGRQQALFTNSPQLSQRKSRAAAVFNDAALSTLENRLDLESRVQIETFAQEFREDPGGFQQAVAGYVKGINSEISQVSPELAQNFSLRAALRSRRELGPILERDYKIKRETQAQTAAARLASMQDELVHAAHDFFMGSGDVSDLVRIQEDLVRVMSAVDIRGVPLYGEGADALATAEYMKIIAMEGVNAQIQSVSSVEELRDMQENLRKGTFTVEVPTPDGMEETNLSDLGFSLTDDFPKVRTRIRERLAEFNRGGEGPSSSELRAAAADLESAYRLQQLDDPRTFEALAVLSSTEEGMVARDRIIRVMEATGLAGLSLDMNASAPWKQEEFIPEIVEDVAQEKGLTLSEQEDLLVETRKRNEREQALAIQDPGALAEEKFPKLKELRDSIPDAPDGNFDFSNPHATVAAVQEWIEMHRVLQGFLGVPATEMELPSEDMTRISKAMSQLRDPDALVGAQALVQGLDEDARSIFLDSLDDEAIDRNRRGLLLLEPRSQLSQRVGNSIRNMQDGPFSMKTLSENAFGVGTFEDFEELMVQERERYHLMFGNEDKIQVDALTNNIALGAIDYRGANGDKSMQDAVAWARNEQDFGFRAVEVEGASGGAEYLLNLPAHVVQEHGAGSLRAALGSTIIKDNLLNVRGLETKDLLINQFKDPTYAEGVRFMSNINRMRFKPMGSRLDTQNPKLFLWDENFGALRRRDDLEPIVFTVNEVMAIYNDIRNKTTEDFLEAGGKI